MKEYNYFYCITNLVNGNFYYGVHKTTNLEDSYMGSGIRVKNAIKKYGKKNFRKDIIKFFDNYEDAMDFESSFVTECLVIDPSCYNMKKGGSGGLGNNGKGEQWYKEHCSRIGKISWMNPEYKEEYRKKASERWKRLIREGKLKSKKFEGKRHSDETKRLIGIKNSLSQKEEKNSQYGTCWITNGSQSKKIHKDDTIPEGWMLGRKMKKK